MNHIWTLDLSKIEISFFLKIIFYLTCMVFSLLDVLFYSFCTPLIAGSRGCSKDQTECDGLLWESKPPLPERRREEEESSFCCCGWWTYWSGICIIFAWFCYRRFIQALSLDSAPCQDIIDWSCRSHTDDVRHMCIFSFSYFWCFIWGFTFYVFVPCHG